MANMVLQYSGGAEACCFACCACPARASSAMQIYHLFFPFDKTILAKTAL